MSTALAAGVIVKALAQRPNFYSAAVYLSQSSANLMILTNLLFVAACTFLLGLQKLLYGDLRPIEIEQLYEKAWFAVTETCLAMTVFRGEIGLTFLAMFFSLLAGKVWGWIGEGRVEVLEQQPPRNPRLFHTRLAMSLSLSVVFDLTMLEYVVKQVMRMARPDMMVMFGFEFAVLSIISMSTAARYAIDLMEIGIVREQKKRRIEEIKIERVAAARTEFQEAQTGQTADAATTDASGTTTAPAPTPTQRTLDQVTLEAFNQPVDDNEVEVEGWEEKGRYMFYLNLATDFFKLVIYLAFFFILLVFYGLPIHILRDVFLTMRSFLKRISDFMKYRTATRDMNARYPDATADEIGREDVCIICREEMHPYEPTVAEPGQPQPRPNPVAERMRPKKLPCGHILHFSCLRSWLERQQICPTCRANVVQTGNAQGQNGAGEQGGAGQANGGQHPPGARQGPRVYQFGPLRIGVGAGNNMFDELQQQLRDEGARPDAARQAPNPDAARQQYGVGLRWSRGRRQTERSMTTQEQIDALDAQIRQEASVLSQNVRELNVLRAMQVEMERLRSQRPTEDQGQGNTTTQPPAPPTGSNTQRIVHRSTALASDDPPNIIPAGSDRLPAGLTLPEGWTMMPLHPSHQVTQVHQHHHHASPAMQSWPAAQQMQMQMQVPMPMPMFPPNVQQFPFQPQYQGDPPPNDAQPPNGTTHERVPASENTGASTEHTGTQAQQFTTLPAQPSEPQGRRVPRLPTFHAPPSSMEQLQAVQQEQLQFANILSNVTSHMENQVNARIAAAQAAARAAAQTIPNGSVPGRNSTFQNNATEDRNGHDPSPTEEAPAPSTNMTSLPSWGSTVVEPGHSRRSRQTSQESSANPPQVNGSHDHMDDSTPESGTSSPTQPKDRNPTVEDLLDDPD